MDENPLRPQPAGAPTLAELGAELDLALAVEHAALERVRAEGTGRHDDPIELAYEATLRVTGDLVRRIAEVPAASLDDLKVKARALRWYHLGESQDFGNCPDEALAVQIASGLLDERVGQ